MATRFRWLGHSALLFESDDQQILLDPFLTGNPFAPISAAEVEADYILISHGHGVQRLARAESIANTIRVILVATTGLHFDLLFQMSFEETSRM